MNSLALHLLTVLVNVPLVELHCFVHWWQIVCFLTMRVVITLEQPVCSWLYSFGKWRVSWLFGRCLHWFVFWLWAVNREQFWLEAFVVGNASQFGIDCIVLLFAVIVVVFLLCFLLILYDQHSGQQLRKWHSRQLFAFCLNVAQSPVQWILALFLFTRIARLDRHLLDQHLQLIMSHFLGISVVSKGLAHQSHGFTGSVDSEVLRCLDNSHLLEDVFAFLKQIAGEGNVLFETHHGMRMQLYSSFWRYWVYALVHVLIDTSWISVKSVLKSFAEFIWNKIISMMSISEFYSSNIIALCNISN